MKEYDVPVTQGAQLRSLHNLEDPTWWFYNRL